MCCAEFIVKYVLFFANLVFSLAGLVLLALGITVLVQLKNIEVLQESAIEAIPIAVIVLGVVVFFIAFFGCCGAIRESKCLLLTYSIIMVLLAAGKTYLAVVLFRGLNKIQDLVEGWVGTAFNKPIREPFHVLEVTFRCCGTTGWNSYTGILPALPPSCCETPLPDNTCPVLGSFEGCNTRVANFFDSFGSAIGGVIVTVIVVEVVAVIFGLFLCYSIKNKRRVRTA